jgi:hypothetical protein
MGTATIGGTPTTAYRASYSQTIGEPSGPDLKVSYTLEVWVDDASLVRHLRLTMSPPENSAAGGTSSITLDFTDYGQPVNIQPPPPADVVQSSSGLLQSNSASASSVPYGAYCSLRRSRPMRLTLGWHSGTAIGVADDPLCGLPWQAAAGERTEPSIGARWVTWTVDVLRACSGRPQSLALSRGSCGQSAHCPTRRAPR